MKSKELKSMAVTGPLRFLKRCATKALKSPYQVFGDLKQGWKCMGNGKNAFANLCGEESSQTDSPYAENRSLMASNRSYNSSSSGSSCAGSVVQDWMQPEEVNYLSGKHVMVVVDESQESRTALTWALSRIVHRLDFVTLVYVLEAEEFIIGEFRDSLRESIFADRREAKIGEVIASLKSLCAAKRPDVQVEIVVVEGAKGPTIIQQAKILEASILVMGQKKPGFIPRMLKWNISNDVVDYCIENSECLALAVRPKSKKSGGYLINSKWQRNFWLLA